MALAKVTSVAEISTAVITSAYVDLLIDKALFKRHNRRRNRRVAFIISLLAGAFLGASAYRYSSPALAILLSTIVKSMVLFLFLVDKVQRELPTWINLRISFYMG
jgi:uncharacterized membrane protein YoaK (UPF0700 family)